MLARRHPSACCPSASRRASIHEHPLTLYPTQLPATRRTSALHDASRHHQQIPYQQQYLFACLSTAMKSIRYLTQRMARVLVVRPAHISSATANERTDLRKSAGHNRRIGPEQIRLKTRCVMQIWRQCRACAHQDELGACLRHAASPRRDCSGFNLDQRTGLQRERSRTVGIHLLMQLCGRGRTKLRGRSGLWILRVTATTVRQCRPSEGR